MCEFRRLRTLFTVVGALILASSSCECSDTEGRPWRLETGTDADVRFDVDDGGDAVDTQLDTASDTDVSDAVDTTDVPTDTCVDQTDFDISYFEIARDTRGGEGAPVLTDGFVFTEIEDQTEPMGGDVEVAKRHPDRVIWTYNGVSDRLRGGASGHLLVERSVPDDNSVRPVIVDRSAEERGPEAFSDRWDGAGFPAYQQGSVRRFDGERFAFILENDPNQTPGWVGYYDGESVEEIHIKEWTRGPVSLIPNGFVLNIRTGPLSGGGNLDVYTYRDDESVAPLTETDRHEWGVVATSESIFYNTDSRVHSADAETGETEVIQDGQTCSPVGADGERAVFSCEAGIADTTSYDRVIFGRQLHYYDGRETRSVPTGGGIVYSARIHGDHVVWAEYDEIFGERPREVGEIRYWRTGADESVRVDTIGAPCRTCALEYPDVHLSVGDGLIAWNYAQNDGEPMGPQTNGGMAEIVSTCGRN